MSSENFEKDHRHRFRFNIKIKLSYVSKSLVSEYYNLLINLMHEKYIERRQTTRSIVGSRCHSQKEFVLGLLKLDHLIP